MCYIYSFSTVAKKISWFEHCWMTQQIFFFTVVFWGNFIIFLLFVFLLICRVRLSQGQGVGISLPVLSYCSSRFSLAFLAAGHSRSVVRLVGEGSALLSYSSALDSASPLTGEHLAGHCPSTSSSRCLHHSFPCELLGQNYQKQPWVFDVFIFEELSSWVSTELNTRAAPVTGWALIAAWNQAWSVFNGIYCLEENCASNLSKIWEKSKRRGLTLLW